MHEKMAPVVLSFDQIVDHARLPDLIRRQSGALVGAFEADPRPTSVFATQQRWLMAHAALGLYFRSEHRRIVFSDFLNLVARHQVASRNTAHAFIKEMVQYGLAHPVDDARDRRTRPVVPGEESLRQIGGWLMLHLATLDGLDDGARVQAASADAGVLARVQPLIADALLTTPSIREPAGTFALFTWLNGGGIVMDRIMTSIPQVGTAAGRIPTGIASLDQLTGALPLSRSHLMRKLREAEAMGSLGWENGGDRPVLWISHGFWREYVAAQAVKLAIIDRACSAVTGACRIDPVASPHPLDL